MSILSVVRRAIVDCLGRLCGQTQPIRCAQDEPTMSGTCVPQTTRSSNNALRTCSSHRILLEPESEPDE